MTRIVLLLFALALAAPAAHAQLGGLGVPSLPDVGGVVGRTTAATTETLENVQDLTEARANEVRALLRRHRRELEADPQGEPIIRSQILALAPSPEALNRARALGFEVIRSDALEGGDALVVLRAPRGVSTRRALQRLRQADPGGVYDFDHLHLDSGLAVTAPATAQQGAAGGPRIGLIDGGVADGGAVVAQRAFSSATPVVSTHGRAVATLLQRAAPGARLYVADIYGGAPTGGSSAALARALSWLSEENVRVINVSLVGPRNRIVEAVIAHTLQRGVVIVAAVGNDGPAARPLFPSAYPGVIGVTGVDARGRVLPEAGRGAHVDFAAPGIHADPRVRGTSFAAPIVAGLLASTSLERLRSSAQDLGARGRDDVYGDGLVGGNLLSAER